MSKGDEAPPLKRRETDEELRRLRKRDSLSNNLQDEQVDTVEECPYKNIRVTIAPSPAIVELQQHGWTPVRLTATGVPDDAGGTYQWRIIYDDCGAQFFGGQDDSAQVGVWALRPGVAVVEVEYELYGSRAVDRAAVYYHDRVEVNIEDPSPLSMGIRIAGYDPPNSDVGLVYIDAVGSPPGGRYRWRIMDQDSPVRFHNNVDPGDSTTAAIEGLKMGTAQVRVEYTRDIVNRMGGIVTSITATDDIILRVGEDHCSAVHWKAAGQNVTPHARLELCNHHPDVQNNVRIYHPYEGVCLACSKGGGQHAVRTVRHYIPTQRGYNALQEVVELCNQIRTYLTFDYEDEWTDYANDNKPWLHGILEKHFRTFKMINNKRERVSRGRAVGMLLGRNVNDEIVRLRATSGALSFYYPATHPTKANFPNTYWSPPNPVPAHIGSATWGIHEYNIPVVDNEDGDSLAPNGMEQFGRCAATALLTHALQLQLELLCMAEIFFDPFGRHRNEEVKVSDIFASCVNCRSYLGEMLCEYGGQARASAQWGNGWAPHEPPNKGLPE